MPYYQSNTLKYKLASSGRRGGGEVLERICSKLGGGLDKAIVPVDSSVVPIDGPYTHRAGELQDMVLRSMGCVNINSEYTTIDFHFSILDYLKTVNNPENDLYFYHSDHLGSSSFITDADGIVTQHLQYLPYGELFVEQRDAANYYTPYKFSAKEKDEETGYSYFGARYYMSDVSVWLSVDPLADKRSWESPYSYCGNNPVKRIDPTGLIWDESGLTTSQREKWNNSMELACKNSALFKKMFTQLTNSKTVYKVNVGKTSDDAPAQFDAKTNTLTFKEDQGISNSNTYVEEIFHTYQKDNKPLYDQKKSFNYEFEAKIAKFFIMRELGSGIGSLGGLSDLFSAIDKVTNYSIPSYKALTHPLIKQLYRIEANKYGDNNRSTNYGNSHYQDRTEQDPVSLYKMFKNAR